MLPRSLIDVGMRSERRRWVQVWLRAWERRDEGDHWMAQEMVEAVVSLTSLSSAEVLCLPPLRFSSHPQARQVTKEIIAVLLVYVSSEQVDETETKEKKEREGEMETEMNEEEARKKEEEASKAQSLFSFKLLGLSALRQNSQVRRRNI
eukprot:600963-Hanusia_phi.AAC.2